MASVVLLGTLDTKGAEHAFLRERLPSEIAITESMRRSRRITPTAVTMSREPAHGRRSGVTKEESPVPPKEEIRDLPLTPEGVWRALRERPAP